MKYKYLSFALPIFFVMACSSTEEPGNGLLPDEYGDDVIRFAVPTIEMDDPEVTTRATLMDAVAENTTFGVLGYCVPYALTTDVPDYRGGISDWLTKKTLCCADVMYKEPIFYDGEKCVYKNHKDDLTLPKRWYTVEDTEGAPVGRYLYTFIAYHPYEQVNGGGFSVVPDRATTRGVPKLIYTMPYSGGGLSTPLSLDAAQDVMVATAFDRSASQGAVAFNFKHILTGLRLQINNYNKEKTVTIHSLSIDGNFYRVAEIDFSPADPKQSVTDETYSGTFHFLQGANVAIEANDSQVIGATDDNTQGTAILLLPKFDATAPSGTSSIPYLGTNKSIYVTYSYPGENEVTKKIENFSLGRIPEQGTCYTLNLNFIGSEITLMFTADSIEYWEAGSDNQIIIN